MSSLVDNMYFRSRSGTLVQKPFQAGIIVSINATIDLYKELKSEGVQYLLTSTLIKMPWKMYFPI